MPTAENVVLVDANETPSTMSQGGHIFNSESYDQIIPSIRTPISAGSGGTQLQNIPCGKVIIANASGNTLMFIGGVGDYAPFSGRGLSLYGNTSITIPVKNTNSISMMATTSGQYIEYLAFLIGVAVPVDTSGIYITPDTTPPTLVSVQPTSGASGVATNADIIATFSEALAPASVTTTAFTVRLTGSSTNLSGITFVDTDTPTQAVFIPYSGIILTSGTYVGRLATTITDVAGNALAASGIWSWTTAAGAPPPDTTPPKVSGTNPTSGALSIAINTSPTVSFSEQVQSGTVNTTTLSVKQSGSSVTSAVSLAADLKTATINPSSDLSYSSIYNIHVTSGVKDLAGNFLSPNVSGRPFTTVDPPLTLIYTVSKPATEDDIHLDDHTFRLAEVPSNNTSPLYGQEIQKVAFYLRKEGTLASDASGILIYMRRATDKSIVAYFGNQNPSTLTTSYALYTYTNTDNRVTMESGDMIEIQYLSGDTTNKVGVVATTTNAFTGAFVRRYDGATYSGGAYVSETARDLAGNLYAG